MPDWKDEDADIVFDGKINVPYTWTVGSTLSKFYGELKDNGKIWGNQCPSCGKVFEVPLQKLGQHPVQTAPPADGPQHQFSDKSAVPEIQVQLFLQKLMDIFIPLFRALEDLQREGTGEYAGGGSRWGRHRHMLYSL